MGLNEELNVPCATVQNFIMSVRAAMPNNPYHNWTHVADVVQVKQAAAPARRTKDLASIRAASVIAKGFGLMEDLVFTEATAAERPVARTQV